MCYQCLWAGFEFWSLSDSVFLLHTALPGQELWPSSLLGSHFSDIIWRAIGPGEVQPCGQGRHTCLTAWVERVWERATLAGCGGRGRSGCLLLLPEKRKAVAPSWIQRSWWEMLRKTGSGSFLLRLATWSIPWPFVLELWLILFCLSCLSHSPGPRHHHPAQDIQVP